MALPADFSKIFGSTATGGLTPIGDVNYAKGWEFVGSNPPTKNDFSYLQNLSDLKSQWLYANKLQRTDPFGDIKSDGAVETAIKNLGLGEAAKRNVGTGENQIPDMNNFTSSLTSPGWQKLPSGLIIQWGTANPSSTGEVFITFPVAFSAYPMYVGFGPQQVSLPNVVQSPVISAPTITNLGCGVRNLMIPTAGGVPVASMSSFFWIAVGK